jgi:hypothetical protein
MSTIRLRIGVLGCAWLFSAPFFSFAQASFPQANLSFTRTDNNSIAASVEDGASAPSANAAIASLERTLVRAVRAEFSPLSFVADTESDAGEVSLAQVVLAQAQGNPQNPEKPPATNPSAPSLGDLGFPTAQTQGDAQTQARLDKRSHMLKIHQRLGLITTIPLAATLLTGGLAGGKSTSSATRDMHAALGTVTAGLYLATAYYSIFAPKVPGTTTRGPIRLHKALAFIHGPGMILTPILGAMAFDQKSRGEKVHGIASAHGAVAAVTGIAYGLAILSVSVKF